MQTHVGVSGAAGCMRAGVPCSPLPPRLQHATPAPFLGGSSSASSASLSSRTSAPGSIRQACRPTSSSASGRRPLQVLATRAGGGAARSGAPDLKDRILASLPYLLPFLNCFTYGRFLFQMYPLLKATVVKPAMPLLLAYHSLPFGSLLVFFGIYMGVVNNQNLSRYVRFNAMQAILLDIVLVLPRLVEAVLTPPRSGLGLELYINSQSFVWIFTATWVVFGVASCLAGHWARIPFIAESADAQIR